MFAVAHFPKSVAFFLVNTWGLLSLFPSIGVTPVYSFNTSVGDSENLLCAHSLEVEAATSVTAFTAPSYIDFVPQPWP